jgi:type II secretory pathway pseudopilin PulG
LRDPGLLPMGRDVKVRSEEGFGLIEVLIAIVMLNVGILALVAAFQSGALALRRASHTSTASTLADSQMELYRGLTYATIGFESGQIAGLDNTYKCDSALGGSCPNTITTCNSTGTSCANGTVPAYTCGTTNQWCLPTRTVSGTSAPDHYNYRIDSYITYSTPTNGRQLKQVTVVVRDGNDNTKTLARETSTFDPTVSG